MWKLVSCEVQGRGHIKSGTPCQDRTKYLIRNNVSVIALADGAGSAKLSHLGAECVVEHISVYVADHFQELIENPDGRQVKISIMEGLQRELASKAETLECKLVDLAATLLLVAVCGDKYIIVHIGDGVVGYLNGSELKIASSPDNGEFANVTTFVTSKEALTSMRLLKGNIKDISGFILMSDGTEESLYHKPTKTLAKSVIKLMHRTCLVHRDVMTAQLSEALTNVISKKTQDDCSIAIMARPFGMLLQIEDMDLDARCDLFRINKNSRNIKKRISRYTDILSLLVESSHLKQVSRKIHLRPRYTKRHLDRLLSLGLITKEGTLYAKI